MPSSVLHLLISTAEVTRLVSTNDRGRVVSSPEEVYSNIRCRKHTPSARDLETAEAMAAIAHVVFYFEPGADIRVEDRISMSDASGRYEVTGLLPPSIAHHLKVFAKDVQRAFRQPEAPAP